MTRDWRSRQNDSRFALVDAVPRFIVVTLTEPTLETPECWPKSQWHSSYRSWPFTLQRSAISINRVATPPPFTISAFEVRVPPVRLTVDACADSSLRPMEKVC